jgi:hypothetical protein
VCYCTLKTFGSVQRCLINWHEHFSWYHLPMMSFKFDIFLTFTFLSCISLELKKDQPSFPLFENTSSETFYLTSKSFCAWYLIEKCLWLIIIKDRNQTVVNTSGYGKSSLHRDIWVSVKLTNKCYRITL